MNHEATREMWSWGKMTKPLPPPTPPSPYQKKPLKQTKNLEENSKNIFFGDVQGEEAALQTLLWFRQQKRQELCRAEENFSRKNAIELRGRKI